MIRIQGLENCKIHEDTAITVGKFDGIHRGHELLAGKIKEMKSQGLASCIVTFEDSPRKTLDDESAQNLISNDERALLLENEGIDYLCEVEFTDSLMRMEPEDFIQMLVDQMQMKHMVVGSDFRFGYMGKGDADLLRKHSEKMGFTLEVVSKLQDGDAGKDISSTYIRQEIKDGHIAKANELLGYPYFVWGEIVHGNHIGHIIGIPTININPAGDKLLPPFGVYATEVEVDGRKYHGMTNVGVKPTIKGVYAPGVETHILDFNQDIYGKNARVIFLEWLRPEQKFPSLDALKEQLKQDKKNTYDYFNHR